MWVGAVGRVPWWRALVPVGDVVDRRSSRSELPRRIMRRRRRAGAAATRAHLVFAQRFLYKGLVLRWLLLELLLLASVFKLRVQILLTAIRNA